MANTAARELPPTSRLSDAVRRSLLAICLSSILCLPLGAETPQDVQKIAEQAIRRLDLQTELPRVPEPPRFTFKLPDEVLWVVIVIAVALLLYAFRDLIPVLRSRQSGAWDGEEAAPTAVAGRSPAAVLGAADELAAAGRFVEAMHVLLLQGLADIRARLDEQFADSLTSREILRSAKLSEVGRRSLRDIVDRVEWTYFGEHPAALADYVACRESFHALAQTLEQGAHA
jgi:hypothetical protein